MKEYNLNKQKQVKTEILKIILKFMKIAEALN